VFPLTPASVTTDVDRAFFRQRKHHAQLWLTLTGRLREIERGKMREGYIPYRAYWSTPFARWQGSFAHLHALKFGASTAKAELARRNIPPQAFDYAVLGTTIPQHGSF
jgi:hypothetical protein